jgi:hypothetical protein
MSNGYVKRTSLSASMSVRVLYQLAWSLLRIVTKSMYRNAPPFTILNALIRITVSLQQRHMTIISRKGGRGGVL